MPLRNKASFFHVLHPIQWIYNTARLNSLFIYLWKVKLWRFCFNIGNSVYQPWFLRKQRPLIDGEAKKEENPTTHSENKGANLFCLLALDKQWLKAQKKSMVLFIKDHQKHTTTCVRDYDSSTLILFNRRPLFSETHYNHTCISITPTQPCNEKNDNNIPTVCFFHGHSTTTPWKNTDSKPSGCHRTGTEKLKFKQGMKEACWQENRHKKQILYWSRKGMVEGRGQGTLLRMDLRGFERGVPYC